MYRIPLFKVFMSPNVMKPLKETLYSGYIAEGEMVRKFEKALANYIGNPYVLTINSCTTAIRLALRLAGVGPGDEVISSPMTCVATNMPVMEAHARIVWADVNPKTGNIDFRDIKRKIKDRAKAILYVHWAGDPGDIDEINEVARKHDLKVIEDAAHAFGAEYKGVKVGNHSDYVCFSFQAIKHVTCGDGGALFVKNKEDYERGNRLKWFGIDRQTFRDSRGEIRYEDDVPEYGHKFHMNNVAATIGLENLKHIEENLRIFRRNGEFYTRELSNTLGITMLERRPYTKSSYWVYTLLAEKRDKLMEKLFNHGVHCSKVHVRNDKYTCFKESRNGPFLGLDWFSERYLSIPSGWWVTEEDAAYIVDVINKGW